MSGAIVFETLFDLLQYRSEQGTGEAGGGFFPGVGAFPVPACSSGNVDQLPRLRAVVNLTGAYSAFIDRALQRHPSTWWKKNASDYSLARSKKSLNNLRSCRIPAADDLR
jgi:hypothetical protein